MSLRQTCICSLSNLQLYIIADSFIPCALVLFHFTHLRIFSNFASHQLGSFPYSHNLLFTKRDHLFTINGDLILVLYPLGQLTQHVTHALCRISISTFDGPNHLRRFRFLLSHQVGVEDNRQYSKELNALLLGTTQISTASCRPPRSKQTTQGLRVSKKFRFTLMRDSMGYDDLNLGRDVCMDC